MTKNEEQPTESPSETPNKGHFSRKPANNPARHELHTHHENTTEDSKVTPTKPVYGRPNQTQ